jgi:ElaB/YqjD/DUF883 family membrane-anchored ribosome-binding protein
MTNDDQHGATTAFDALLEKMKRDVEEMEKAETPAGGAAAKLKAIFDAALQEAGAAKENAAQKLHEGAEKARDQLKAHPVTTISAAFAAGYMIGKSIAGRVKR